MKSMRYLRVVLLFISSTFTHSLFAQNCTPDSTFADAPLGLYPTPFDESVFPDGGLADFPATIGLPYELTFTVKLTDRVNIPPFNFDLDSFALNNSDAIIGLPLGLDYACNPPNCVFPDSVLGCIIILGTPLEANPEGDYNLQIMGQLFANGDDSLDFSFPSPAIPGEYILALGLSDSLDMDSMMVDSMMMDSMMVDSMDIDSMMVDSMDMDSMMVDSMDMDSMMVDSMDMGAIDADEDGIIDSLDNCLGLANPNQIDMDGDGVGAACDCDDSELIGFNCSDGCLTFYADNDGDGFGNSNIIRIACTSPAGFVLSGADCDDTNPAINPDAIEIPDNGIDENCNNLTDESNDLISWFLDADGDGFGNPLIDSLSIAQPRNYVSNSNDCDDTNQLIYENALEIVDNLDNNCDGFVDNFAGNCEDLTNPGTVGIDQVVCPENPNPSIINNIEAPSGGSGDIEIMWMRTTDNPDNGNAQWMLIPNSHALSYTPAAVGQTTYFRRCVRRSGCTKFLQESNIVTIAFGRVCEQIVEIIEEEEEEMIEMEEEEEEFDPCLENPILVTAAATDPDCNVSNGSINLMVSGGTAPYSFAWEPAFPDTNRLDSLPEGIYSVTVLDSLNCFANFSEILAEPDTCSSPPGLAPEDFGFGRVQANVLDNKIVGIEWETKNETATGSYLLEHSKTGDAFKALSLGKKATGRSQNYYQVNDLTPTLGTSFYRVKYITESGHYAYSPSVQVLITPEGSPLFIAYPNPFGEQLTIDFLSPLEEAVSLVILDNLGQVLHSIQIPAGTLRQEISLPEAAKGLFTLQIATEKARWVKKVMKIE